MEINKNVSAALQTGVQTQAVSGSSTKDQESVKTEAVNTAGSTDTVTISEEAQALLEAEASTTATPFNGGGNEPPIPPKAQN